MTLFLFVLGLAVGSFLNVCIDRLPKNKSLMGRSKCDHCKKKIQARDLIPVISFLILKRKCRYCRKKLSFYYPLVELLTAIAFVLVWTYLPVKMSSPTSIGDPAWIPAFAGMTKVSQMNILVKMTYLGLFSVFIGIFFVDLKYQIIPDEFQVALLLFGIFLAYFTGGAGFKELSELVVDGLIVMSPMYLLYLITNGKGLGFGDVKLSFTIGFLFGVIGGLIALYLGFVFGALVGIFLLTSGQKKWKSRIAFGPFLVLGSLVMIFFSKKIMILLTFFK